MRILFFLTTFLFLFLISCHDAPVYPPTCQTESFKLSLTIPDELFSQLHVVILYHSSVLSGETLIDAKEIELPEYKRDHVISLLDFESGTNYFYVIMSAKTGDNKWRVIFSPLNSVEVCN